MKRLLILFTALYLSYFTTISAQTSVQLDVAGKIKIDDDASTPQAGMIRWNTTTQDFEGYNGTVWVSLTSFIGDRIADGDNDTKVLVEETRR